MNKTDKIAGALNGLIVGDILAAPLKAIDYNNRRNFFPVDKLVEPFNFEELYNSGMYRNDLRNRVTNWFPAGFYSFYTQQALLVLESLYSIQDFDIEDISQKLVKYSYPRDRTSPLGIFRGYTRSFYDSVQNISNGLPLKVCGVTNNIGDGQFKSIPAALFYGFEIKVLRDKAFELTLLTNRDVANLVSSAVFAYTIAQTSNKSFFNVDEELKAIADFAKNSEDYVLKRFSDFLPDGEQNKNKVSGIVERIISCKDASVEDGIRSIKAYASDNNIPESSAPVITALSLFLFIKSIGSFELSLRSALENDMETEVIAPLVGALSGSLLGIEKIPAKWLDLIPNKVDLMNIAGNLKNSENRPKGRNFYIKEIELSYEQYAQKEKYLLKLDEETVSAD